MRNEMMLMFADIIIHFYIDYSSFREADVQKENKKKIVSVNDVSFDKKNAFFSN